jgi:hypothetical protein
MPTRRYRLASLLKNGHCNIPRHTREIIEELVKRFAGLKIVEQVLHRDAGASEDRNAPLNLEVDDDVNLAHCEMIRRPRPAVANVTKLTGPRPLTLASKKIYARGSG